MQIHNDGHIYFLDYYFDAYGNISKINFQDNVFSSLYRDNRPWYWTCPDFRFDLQWDYQGFLNLIKIPEIGFEFRYTYNKDAAGNWIKRQEMAYAVKHGLFVPVDPASLEENLGITSGGVWNREITY